ncbi:MAG TPA: nuclear transport factor 2 family protein [Gemmatimonadaceae bacterium]|nr:nuclear transport factor 2 family protein [Gemmatimonadaceae bacterium]
MHGLTSLDAREVDAFVRSWERWFDAGDYATMAAFYAEDARLVATHTATVAGRAAIEAFLRMAGERTRAAGLARRVHLERVESAGELGYMRGTVLLRRPGAGEATTVRYVTLWKRQADGAWRLIEDISSAAPPPGLAHGPGGESR